MMRRMIDSPPMLAKINVTPIIDVALVLVIILMVTAPMMAVAQLGLELPKARTQSLGDEDRIHVSLGRDGQLAIGEKIIARDAFVAELSAELATKDEEPLVVIRADAGATHGVVRGLLDDARAAGAPRVALATNPPTEATR